MAVETTIIEGVEYVLKSKFDATIQGMDQRISKLSSQKNEAETSFATTQEQIDEMKGRLGLVDNLQKQTQDLQSKLEQSNTRYDRHSHLSGLGINDDSQRATFEMFYNQHLQGLPEGQERPQFGEWVTNLSSNPADAPLILQSVFSAPPATSPAVASSETPAQPFQSIQAATPAPPAPPSNIGVVGSQNTMSKAQILDRAAGDSQFYKQNREMVKHLHNPSKYPKPEIS
tara:strand:+ start:3541 stop:4227 length:687 start_codon:yes stop_codon:yes gene_type:complete